MLCSLVQTSYTKDRAMVLLCFLNFLGKPTADRKTQLANTALLWGDHKRSEAAGQKVMDFKKRIVPVDIHNS